MSFVTIDFALFVAATLIVYYAVSEKYRWIVLLVASYTFYWQSGPGNLLYILLTTVSSYLCAKKIESAAQAADERISSAKDQLTKEEKKSIRTKSRQKQRFFLTFALIFNFGILIFVKYANPTLTFITNYVTAYINYFRVSFFSSTEMIPFQNFIFPLGISFYTLQTMGYLIDLYHGQYKRERNFFRFALYVSFFPQIVQGPISRFGQLAPELFSSKRFDAYRIKSGFCRVMWGLFKKLIIADRLAVYVSAAIAERATYKGMYTVLAIFFYSMQLYGDFSGGIDVALGVSEMFGIKLAENFDRPFFSKSISEFWQRWHITLGTWFRDYIFYPISLDKRVIKLSKYCRNHNKINLGKKLPIYISMFFVWIATGMWHGSQMRFVVWGLLNFVFIVLGTEAEPLSRKITAKFGLNESGWGMKSYRVIKTFWLMTFLRIFDLSKDVPAAFDIFRSVFSGWGDFNIERVYDSLGLAKEDLIVAICAIIIMFVVELIQRKGSVRKRILELPTPLCWLTVSLLIAAVAVFGIYGPGYDADSFIYGAL